MFRVSGDTNFENFHARRQPWWRLRGFDVCNDLQKNSGYVTGSRKGFLEYHRSILILLQLDYGQISNKDCILKYDSYYMEALIRGYKLFKKCIG